MSAGLTVLAVDDEAPSLDELCYLLHRSASVERVEIARSATDALRRLRDEEYDAVLLDIRMPGLDGMELARVLARFAKPPSIIFVTAHEAHALEAFEVGASGYLLKPVDAARLEKVLARTLGSSRHNGVQQGHDTVAVDAGNRTILVARSDITWVESAGDYVRLHVRDGTSHLLRTPLAVLEDVWAEHGFARIHRSYLVSLRDIAELRTDGSHTSVRVAGQDLPVSRRHLRELHDRLVRQSRPTSR